MYSINRKWLKPLRTLVLRLHLKSTCRVMRRLTTVAPHCLAYVPYRDGTAEDSRVVFPILFSPANKNVSYLTSQPSSSSGIYLKGELD